MRAFIRNRLCRLPLGLLGCIILILCFEWFVYENSLKFSTLEFDDWRMTRQMATSGLERGGVLLCGDSQVKMGVSPLTLEAKLGVPCQTLAVRGGQTPASYLLLKQALRSGAAPKAIVVDFEPHLLASDRSMNQPMWSEIASPDEALALSMPNRDFDLFAATITNSIFLSCHERLGIRQNILAALRGETPSLANRLRVLRRNQSVNRGAVLLARPVPSTPGNVGFWANFAQDAWRPDPINDRYARLFLALAREHRIPVYCLLMPVMPGLLEKARQNGMERNYLTWIKQLQSENPELTVLSWRDSGYQPETFSDELHLNKEGAASLTLALANYLRDPASPSRGHQWVEMVPFRLDGSEVALEDYVMSTAIVQSLATRNRHGDREPKQIAVDPSKKVR